MATSNGAEEAGDLSAAAMWGDKELLESLLKGGADPDFPNAQGDSALHEAAYYGEVECASILLDHKGRVGKGSGGLAQLVGVYGLGNWEGACLS